MRPGNRNPFTPSANSRSVNNRRSFSLFVLFCYIQTVSVSIPRNLNSCRRVIPAKVYAVNDRPIVRNRHWVALNLLLRDWKHTARTHAWNALNPRFPLVWRVTVDNRLPLFFCVMLRVIYRHADYRTAHAAIGSSSFKNMLTTSDMPKSGVNVIRVMPFVAFVRVKPSM